ncbi:LysR family transcriptional regulator [Azospirillum thermophilum]|uniref:LysR family transcriptional regulator n=1 Tax=Azospirillum thermophilum TaxID=2202148 RepID=A0A2S2CLI9_9PROT|nr:LysR family transcriptional regulator [Azospirillum thermophilum]AWK85326.1 LysR family transcriptional regulator [Azospirillum thermophilum]
MAMMQLEAVDLRLLRMFMTIVEAGGFTAAQGELNLSLSTISTHFSDLEARLGVRLCRRGRSGFQLTAEGQSVYEELRRVFDTLDRFQARVRGLRDRLTGTLTIGLVDNTLTDPKARLERVFARFSEEAPEVSLSINVRPPNELLRDVIGGQLQVAISSFPRIIPSLSYQDLYQETNHFYCGEGHPLFTASEEAIDLDEVRRYRLVSRAYWGYRDLKIFAITTPKATVSDIEGAARLILSGTYLGYLPDHFAAGYVKQGRLRVLLPKQLSYQAPFQVAYDANRARSPVVELFIAIVKEELGSGGPRGSVSLPP